MIELCHRLISLDRSRRRLVFEAAALMALVWAGLRLLPFLTLRRILDEYVTATTARNVTSAHPGTIGSIGWAITSVAARFSSATCLVQALAADAMLRRRRLASQVHFGVRIRRDRDVPIDGHAWVESNGGMTIGVVEGQSDFNVLTSMRER